MGSLWDLLTLVCVSLSLGAGIAMARAANKGVVGYTLAVVLGLLNGVVFAGIRQIYGLKVLNWVKRKQPEKLQEHYFRAVYLIGFIWILIGFIVSAQFVRGALRLLP